jgi:muconolactone D-isomerase
VLGIQHSANAFHHLDSGALEFLVQIAVTLPPTMPAPERERLLAAELERGRELIAAGSIRDIWRIPGALRNVGVWEAVDATELHDLIASLPLFPYLAAEVTPLAVHPLRRRPS